MKRMDIACTTFWILFNLEVLSRNTVHMASDGAKSYACADMYPGHGAIEQRGDSPYIISLSSSSYYPLNNITVTVMSNSVHGFKGFLCQARREIGTYVTYGKLSQTGNTAMNNFCNQEASLTQADAGVKSSVSFVWTAPETDSGEITIVCTIVQQYSVFWTRVTSPKIIFAGPVTQSTRPHPSFSTPYSFSTSPGSSSTPNTASISMNLSSSSSSSNRTVSIAPTSVDVSSSTGSSNRTVTTLVNTSEISSRSTLVFTSTDSSVNSVTLPKPTPSIFIISLIIYVSPLIHGHHLVIP